MPNSLTNIYDFLLTEYPARVFVNEFPQATVLQVDAPNILISDVIDTPNPNKDYAILDAKNIRIQVIGTNFGNCKEVAKWIREALNGYTDTYIIECNFDALNKIDNLGDGLCQYALDFQVYEPNAEYIPPLRNPYREHKVVINIDEFNGGYPPIFDITNLNEPNYMPLTWQVDNLTTVSTTIDLDYQNVRLFHRLTGEVHGIPEQEEDLVRIYYDAGSGGITISNRLNAGFIAEIWIIADL